MTTQELEPPGFQPKLLAYIPAVELHATSSRVLGEIERSQKRGERGKMGDIIDRLGKTEAERLRLAYALGTVQRMTKGNVGLTQIEGIHVWSTTNPTTSNPEFIFKRDITTTPKSPRFRPVPEADRISLVGFFRANTADIAPLTRAWWDLSKPQAPGQRHLPESVEPFADGLQRYANTPERDSALKAIQFCNLRLEEAQARFTGDELEAAQHSVYSARAHLQGFLVEQGGLRYPSRLRSLACLSQATDLMRLDLLFGFVTDRANTIADCFGYADMSALQLKVVKRVFGENVQLVYGSALQRGVLREISGESVPQIPEIAFMQQQIAASIQDKL